MRLPNRKEIVKSEYIIIAAGENVGSLGYFAYSQLVKVEQLLNSVLIISNCCSCKYVLQFEKLLDIFAA